MMATKGTKNDQAILEALKTFNPRDLTDAAIDMICAISDIGAKCPEQLTFLHPNPTESNHERRKQEKLANSDGSGNS